MKVLFQNQVTRSAILNSTYIFSTWRKRVIFSLKEENNV